MILLLGIFFIAFTLFYSVISAVVIYHLRRFAFPDQRTTTLAIRSFLLCSFFLWITSLIALLRPAV